MAKYCPVLKEKVLYLECLECEDKQICKELNKASYSDTGSSKPENDDSIFIIKNEDETSCL